MDRKTYELVGPDYPGNRVEDVKDPSLGWMISFLFLIALLGPFAIVVLRKVYSLLGKSKKKRIITYICTVLCSDFAPPLVAAALVLKFCVPYIL